MRLGRLRTLAGSLVVSLAAAAAVGVGTATDSGAGSSHRWWSGAASDVAASGAFGTWRGTPIAVGATWNDSFEAQTEQWSICPGGEWSGWNRPLDLSVGAIYHERGETWAKAAKGAYDARWTRALQKVRSCWGRRDAALLYLRFAHEMNLSGSWSVRRGEEAAFRTAMTRFSTLRYAILPRAHLVFGVNDGTDGGLGGLDVRSLWPGRDSRGRRVADVYSVDSYNMWPHVTTAAQFQLKILATGPGGTPLGIETHRRLAAQLGVPFAVSEWSNNGDPHDADGGGESAEYVRSFYAWARSHAGDPARPRAGQLLYECHFNLWTQYQFWPRTLQPRTAAAYRALPWGR